MTLGTQEYRRGLGYICDVGRIAILRFMAEPSIMKCSQSVPIDALALMEMLGMFFSGREEYPHCTAICRSPSSWIQQHTVTVSSQRCRSVRYA